MKYYYVRFGFGYVSIRGTKFEDHGSVICFYLNDVEIAQFQKRNVEYISIIKLFSEPERVYEKEVTN